MKRLFSFLLPCLMLLALCPGAGADPVQPDVYLESSAGTGYLWQAASSNESIATVEELEVIPSSNDKSLVGAPMDTHLRILAVAPGEAEIHFSFCRPMACANPELYFCIPVTVDEVGNVLCSSEIALPRNLDSGWSFQAQWDGILEIDDNGTEGSLHHFSLIPLSDGSDQVVFTHWDANGQQLPGVFTYDLCVTDGQLTITAIRYSREERVDFSPAFSFSAAGCNGDTVTEQIFCRT